jgi:hypothetical protein
MKKINNKVLIIGLAVLVGIFVVSKIFRSPKLESNIRKELVGLDTADITEVRMTSAGDQPATIKLMREKNKWMVIQEDKSYPADKSAVNSLLSTVASLNAERMVSRKQDKWDSYSVGEKSTIVSVYEGGSKATEFRVGKTGFNQNPASGGFGQQGQGIEAYTYVRMADEDEVYSVNGFLEATFNRTVNDLRDKSFLRFSSDNVTKVTFTYPADSSFVLEKRDTVWFVAGRVADKMKVTNYLREISLKSESSFADGFTPPITPTAKIQIEGSSGPFATVEGWKQDTGWYLRSSRQPDVIFLSTDQNAVSRLFVGQSKF